MECVQGRRGGRTGAQEVHEPPCAARPLTACLRWCQSPSGGHAAGHPKWQWEAAPRQTSGGVTVTTEQPPHKSCSGTREGSPGTHCVTSGKDGTRMLIHPGDGPDADIRFSEFELFSFHWETGKTALPTLELRLVNSGKLSFPSQKQSYEV